MANFDRQEISAFQGRLAEIRFRPVPTPNDLVALLSAFRPTFYDTLKQLISTRGAIKCSLIIQINYSSLKFKTNPQFNAFIRTIMYLIYQQDDILSNIHSMERDIMLRNDNFMRNESNLRIEDIVLVGIQYAFFQPLSGGCNTKLPRGLDLKKGIINVQNKDNRCFGYAILAALIVPKLHPTRHKQYQKHFKTWQLDKIKYPVEPTSVPEIETKLNLKINLFSFYDDKGLARYPLYVSQKEIFKREIDLLYWNGHYAWIKNFHRFISDLAPGHYVKSFCKRCFGIFLNPNSFKSHHQICARPDFDSLIFHFPQEGQKLKFTNIQNRAKTPFIIYADFECLLIPTSDTSSSYQNKKQLSHLHNKHIPCAVGFYVIPAASDYFQPYYESYSGQEAAKWFLSRLLQIAQRIDSLFANPKMIQMSYEDCISFAGASTCWICMQPFINPHDKVRDHDHLTGKYRGAAHSNCNLKLHQVKKIPVFIHNFRGYDSHLITLASEHFQGIKLSVIGQSYEKYLIMNFGPQLIFKDSYQFMGFALAQLAKELISSGHDSFIYLKREFSDKSEEQLKLLLRKGVYPYEYMDDWDKLKLEKLPEKEHFFSSLTQQGISDEDYQHAQNVWNSFGCKTMEDYQNIYLKTDVLLLADIFERFRSFSLQHYKLDAAHYVSSPHLAWDAMLSFTGCEVDLINDPEMFNMIDKGMRGGVSMITHRYARANNPELGQLYDSNKELSYIVYLDANNLYGWAMSQKMPIRNFKWVDCTEWENISWINLAEDSQIGYILEVDLEYPIELHDQHDDYPLAPEKICLSYEMLNAYQLKVFSHYSIPKGNLKCQKLIPHFLSRKNYVLHYRNLKFYLEEGMQISKIHKVLKFEQEDWLKAYIVKNQDLRVEVKTDFEKSNCKLFNNSVFGKTCENQKKRSDIKLVNNAKDCKKFIEKPHARGFKIFSNELAAIDLRKIKAKIDKPLYVGFTVLELSKLHMYKFHYRYIKKNFNDRAKLLFTDTDSLMYHIQGCNPYEQFYSDRCEFFDFSSFPKTSKYYDGRNNKIIGKFKDEANGYQVIEFVGLRPKMYSFITNDDKNREKHTAKGIQSAVAKKLKHEDYLAQLENPQERYLQNWRIGSKLHQLYTIETSKRGLCSFDDKGVLLEDGISSHAYGNHKITAEFDHLEKSDIVNKESSDSESEWEGIWDIA